MTFFWQITGTVAALFLVFVGIPWAIRAVKRWDAKRQAEPNAKDRGAAWVVTDDIYIDNGPPLRTSIFDDPQWRQRFADGLARDAANLRGDWQRATDRLAAEAAHPHRPMPGMDPEVLP